MKPIFQILSLVIIFAVLFSSIESRKKKKHNDFAEAEVVESLDDLFSDMETESETEYGNESELQAQNKNKSHNTQCTDNLCAAVCKTQIMGGRACKHGACFPKLTKGKQLCYCFAYKGTRRINCNNVEL